MVRTADTHSCPLKRGVRLRGVGLYSIFQIPMFDNGNLFYKDSESSKMLGYQILTSYSSVQIHTSHLDTVKNFKSYVHKYITTVYIIIYLQIKIYIST